MARNLGWSAELATCLGSRRPFASVIDIGCGIGTWLSYLASLGVRVLGFEPGGAAARFGQDQLGLTIHCGYFKADDARERFGNFDLVTCVMVLEHLRSPRVLIAEIAKYCVASGASAYVSVPFYRGFEQLAYDSESEGYSVFNEVASHVTYFSEEGLKRAFADFGMVANGGKIVTPSNVWAGFMFVPR